MRVKVIGLGKMGFNLVTNLLKENHEVTCFDINEDVLEKVNNVGAKTVSRIEDLFECTNQNLNVYWLMLPSGKVTNEMLELCQKNLQPGDIIIDGGNSRYGDSVAHYYKFKENDIHFLDVGTSGGIGGAKNGACMMIGGDKEAFLEVETIFFSICVENGYLYCGEAGSGHYLKMVHNGIEYGMMQAIGEGFNLLHHANYDYDLEKVAKVFNHGSVIRSWLMELTENALKVNPTLSGISGEIPSSGEGKWTVEEMLELQQSAPVITQSLLTRYSSMDQEKYGEKLIAALRNQFGGHEIPTVKKD